MFVLLFVAGCSKIGPIVSFSAGVGSSNPPASYESEKNEKITLPGQGAMPAPERRAFDGWKIETDAEGKIYLEGEPYIVKGDVRFVAQWRSDDLFRVTFGAGEGSGTLVSPINAAKGAVIVLPGQEEMKAPYWTSFSGWKAVGDASGKIYGEGESFTVNGDVRLIAQWSTTDVGGYSEALLPALPDLTNKGGLLSWPGADSSVAFINVKVTPKANATDPATGLTLSDTTIEYSPYGKSSGKDSFGNTVYYNEYAKEYSPCGEQNCMINGKSEIFDRNDNDGKGYYKYKLDNNGEKIRFRYVIKERVDTTFTRDTLKFAMKTVTKDNLDDFYYALEAALFGGDYTGNGTRGTRGTRAGKDTWTKKETYSYTDSGSLMQVNILLDRLPAGSASLQTDPANAGVPFTGRYNSVATAEIVYETKRNVADFYNENISTYSSVLQFFNHSHNSNLLPTEKGRYKTGKEMFVGGAVAVVSCDYDAVYADVKELVNSGTNPNPTWVTTKKGETVSAFEAKANGTISFGGAYAGTISFNDVRSVYRNRSNKENFPDDGYYDRSFYAYTGEFVIKSGTSELKIDLSDDKNDRVSYSMWKILELFDEFGIIDF